MPYVYGMVKPNQTLKKNVLFALLGKFALEHRKKEVKEERTSAELWG